MRGEGREEDLEAVGGEALEAVEHQVLIGAGHLPILHFCARSSPEYQFVAAGEVLAEQ